MIVKQFEASVCCLVRLLSIEFNIHDKFDALGLNLKRLMAWYCCSIAWNLIKHNVSNISSKMDVYFDRIYNYTMYLHHICF